MDYIYCWQLGQGLGWEHYIGRCNTKAYIESHLNIFHTQKL